MSRDMWQLYFLLRHTILATVDIRRRRLARSRRRASGRCKPIRHRESDTARRDEDSGGSREAKPEKPARGLPGLTAERVSRDGSGARKLGGLPRAWVGDHRTRQSSERLIVLVDLAWFTWCKRNPASFLSCSHSTSLQS